MIDESKIVAPRRLRIVRGQAFIFGGKPYYDKSTHPMDVCYSCVAVKNDDIDSALNQLEEHESKFEILPIKAWIK